MPPKSKSAALSIEIIEQVDKIVAEVPLAKVSLAVMLAASRVRMAALQVLAATLRSRIDGDPASYIANLLAEAPVDSILGEFTAANLVENIHTAIVPYPEFLAACKIIIKDGEVVDERDTTATGSG